MDPLTQVLAIVNTSLQIAKMIVERQTPEQTAQFMDWFIEDQKFWRGLIKKIGPQ